MGRSCRQRFLSLHDGTRIVSIQTKLVDLSQQVCLSGSTRNGAHLRVLPPVGGNGVDPGGLHKNSTKIDERGCMQRLMIEHGNPLCSVFG